MRLPVRATLLATCALVVTLTGCAALSPPERPAYEGQDSVGQVDRSMLLGTWSITVLNPVEGQQQQETLVTYNADGTYSGTFEVPDQGGMTGDMAFEITGNWVVNGDRVDVSNVEMSSTGDDNALGSIISSLVSRQGKRMEGSANVFEASDTHLILVDEEGQALRYDRAA